MRLHVGPWASCSIWKNCSKCFKSPFVGIIYIIVPDDPCDFDSLVVQPLGIMTSPRFRILPHILDKAIEPPDFASIQIFACYAAHLKTREISTRAGSRLVMGSVDRDIIQHTKA